MLWSLDANTSVPDPVWNNDWDGAALVVGDYLLEGGENSWLHVIKLNRGWTRRRQGARAPARRPDGAELGRSSSRVDAPGRHFSIENSVAFDDGVVYFANSAGLVQGWDISRVLRGGRKAKRVFRFWTGDDTDASIVIDEEGYLYVASELEKMNARVARGGPADEARPARGARRPLVWSVPIRETGEAGAGGSWSTPALDRDMVYVATNAGGLLGVDRGSGKVRWRIPLPGPTWSSPVVVDDVLLAGRLRRGPARIRRERRAAEAAASCGGSGSGAASRRRRPCGRGVIYRGHARRARCTRSATGAAKPARSVSRPGRARPIPRV